MHGDKPCLKTILRIRGNLAALAELLIAPVAIQPQTR
jgi:hypothetical protein